MRALDDRTRANGKDRRTYRRFVEDQCAVYRDTISRAELLTIADQAISELFAKPRFNMSEWLITEVVGSIILQRLSLPSFEQWRRTNDVRGEWTSALLDPLGLPLGAGSPPPYVLLAVKEIDERLIRDIQADPQLLHRLTPRKFEHLVADLLMRDGWDVAVTPASRDGGKDIVAKLRTAAGSFLVYVECKKYSPDRPVGVRLVRELLGIVHADRATAGLLVTTSNFSREARRLQECTPHRISLRAYRDLVEWLASARISGT